jgi:hypothetical protein
VEGGPASQRPPANGCKRGWCARGFHGGQAAVGRRNLYHPQHTCTSCRKRSIKAGSRRREASTADSRNAAQRGHTTVQNCHPSTTHTPAQPHRQTPPARWAPVPPHRTCHTDLRTQRVRSVSFSSRSSSSVDLPRRNPTASQRQGVKANTRAGRPPSRTATPQPLEKQRSTQASCPARRHVVTGASGGTEWARNP